jgi:Sulfatase-modifying factor enzyme 1/TIR domain
MAGGGKASPISLFYSYSHKDEGLRDELGEHLFPLERAGLIEVWHDREMLPGDTVDDEIAQKLKTADVVLVLVSPSFIRSPYCYDTEFKNAIERHKEGLARVVPVILRPCQWQVTPLKDLLAMPTDGRAVIEWPNRDTAFNDVATGVRKLATAMRDRGASAASPAAAGARAVVGQTAEWASEPQRRRAEDSGKPTSGSRDLADFAVFRDIDAPWCPEVVALPAGAFLMGSPENETGRYGDEGPQHQVTVGRRFAIGRYPVMFEEYDHFCVATQREKPADQDWGRGRRPVINVSWQDAVAYSEWLAKETGKPYRLLSEAEWEYACRAGTTRRYAFGDAITPKDANYVESKLGRTTEVGAYRRTPGVSTTCTATFGNGSRMSGTMATKGHRLTARPGRMEPLASASSAAAPGSTIRGSSVRRPASGSSPAAAASIWGFALPGRFLRT